MRVLRIILIAVNVLLVVDILRCPFMDSLHRECVLGNSDGVAGLLAAGADVNESMAGKTPLLLAAEHGHLGVVRLLVEAGADVNKADWWEGTPLVEATRGGHVESVAYLLANGADPNLPLKHVHGRPVMLAADRGYDSILALLVEHGAEVNILGDGHSNPLHAAASLGYEEVVEILLDCGADVSLRDGDGKTAWVLAVENGQFGIAKILEDTRVSTLPEPD